MPDPMILAADNIDLTKVAAFKSFIRTFYFRRDKTKFQIVSVTYLPHDIFSTQLVENKSKVHFPRTSIHWNGNFA